jgi:hypothetical protein
LGDGGYRQVVYVGDEPGRSVKRLVGRLVGTPESVLGYPRHLPAPSLETLYESQLTEVRYLYL